MSSRIGKRRGTIPDETLARWRTAVTFQDACQALLSEFTRDFAAEHCFLVLCEETSSGQSRYQVVASDSFDGGDLGDPDYLLDRTFLRQVIDSGQAHYKDGAEVGTGRSLLAYSVVLSDRSRAIALLESRPGSKSLDGDAKQRLEVKLRSAALELGRMRRIDEQARRLEELEARLLSVEGQLPTEAPARRVDEPASDFTASEFTAAAPHLYADGEVVHYHGMITCSPLMSKLFGVIDRIKDSELRTLIYGETGTGKELIARAIHYGSYRASRPFEVISCGSLPTNLLESELFGYRRGAFSGADQDKKGIFERANGGTVFLDEVADMPPEMQQRVLRVLQEEEVRPIGGDVAIPINVRVVSSTRQDLPRLVREKRFREDLYYRLNEMTVDVPPVRDRAEDIPLLLQHFLKERSEEEGVTKRFSESAERELCRYTWPGNVQELRNVVTRTFLSSTRKVISRRVVQPLLQLEGENIFLGDDIHQEGDRLHLSIPYQEGFNEIVSECEKLILLTALRRNRGNKSRVTQQLKIPRQTLYNKLEKYEINAEDYLEKG